VTPRAILHLPRREYYGHSASSGSLPVKPSGDPADETCLEFWINWVLVIVAGAAGLLLGGAWVAVAATLLAHGAVLLSRLLRTQP
jgi:hypothetical protein